MRCIGHGGASALARKNTVDSFALAAELGADSIEFDVRRLDGRLLVAHTKFDGRRRDCLTLEDAVHALAGERFAGVGLVADLKTHGTEEATVELLREHGLLERSLLTSQCRPILARVRAHEPRARLGVSIAGRGSRWLNKWTDWRAEVSRALRDREFEVVTVYRRLVDAELVDRVADAGGELHAWTVRRAADARALASLGVDAIVTPDPRIVTEPAPVAAGSAPAPMPRPARAFGTTARG